MCEAHVLGGSVGGVAEAVEEGGLANVGHANYAHLRAAQRRFRGNSAQGASPGGGQAREEAAP